MNRIAEIRIDDITWNTAEPARRDEWRLAIAELLADSDQGFLAGTHRLRITMSDQSMFLILENESDEPVERTEIPRAALADHITEYVDIVRQIDRAEEGRGSSRLEALDMAKKLAHDSAARTLQRHLQTFGPNHETCRRLWTLLLSLRVDTTRLTGVRGHRPVR